jgi:hypothetical protein
MRKALPGCIAPGLVRGYRNAVDLPFNNKLIIDSERKQQMAGWIIARSAKGKL